ncbi:hypothetical protein [Oceanobacillus neutriphilus]|uniref:Uncharacterized protein n=1 Tax=Oceanobacillus neutriphilus TaxID=531815 RepID=A0ABQ2P3E3_9BACI|nr:hypothetical protein [Oceanobacillus neutriphilus]GGP16873.1 hypothetical protein GCM10011346_50570 [Oceanobacillus neutriphilus]
MKKSKNEKDNKDYFESKERKIEVNVWRKLINVILLTGVFSLLYIYNVSEHTGFILWLLIFITSAVIIDRIVRKIFSLFID